MELFRDNISFLIFGYMLWTVFIPSAPKLGSNNRIERTFAYFRGYITDSIFDDFVTVRIFWLATPTRLPVCVLLSAGYGNLHVNLV